MIFNSYAKVNFFLKIYPKFKKENLHKIYSFFHLHKEIYDEIEILESHQNCVEYFQDSKKLKINDCILKKTLEFLKQEYNISKKYKICVKKKIPVGSGLGGAASNAATLINFIFKNEKIKLKNFFKFLTLGSDIIFFLKKYENAVVKNYGEIVKEKKNPNILYKLVFSKNECLTKIVYNKYDELAINSSKFLIKKQLKYLYEKNTHLLENDLQKSCFVSYPEIKKKYNFYLKKGFHPLISGSGSTIILFERN